MREGGTRVSIAAFTLATIGACATHEETSVGIRSLCWHLPTTSKALDARMADVCAAKLISFSPDGRRILLGNVGDGAQIVDAVTGRLIQPLDLDLPPHKGPPRDGMHSYSPLGDKQRIDFQAWTGDGDILVFASGRVVIVWSVPRGREVRRIDAFALQPPDEEPVYPYALAASPSGVLALGLGQRVRLLDVRNGRALGQPILLPRDGASGQLVFAADGNLLLSEGMMPSVLVIDSKMRSVTPRPLCSESEIHEVAFHASGKSIYVNKGDWNTSLQRVDLESGTILACRNPTETETRICFGYGPDSHVLVVGDGRGNLIFLNEDTLEESGRLVGSGQAVWDVCVGPGGELIGVAYENGAVSVFSVGRLSAQRPVQARKRAEAGD